MRECSCVCCVCVCVMCVVSECVVCVCVWWYGGLLPAQAALHERGAAAVGACVLACARAFACACCGVSARRHVCILVSFCIVDGRHMEEGRGDCRERVCVRLPALPLC